MVEVHSVLKESLVFGNMFSYVGQTHFMDFHFISLIFYNILIIFLLYRCSLQRMQMDYIDLYQIHWPDRFVCRAYSLFFFYNSSSFGCGSFFFFGLGGRGEVG